MNDSLQNGMITLVRSALTGEALPLPEGFDLAACELLIHKHHIGSLLYTGAVNCKMDSNLPIMQKLFAATCKYIQVDVNQRRQLNSVLKAFEENNIDHMPLKGTLLKQMYPSPEMRVMGDADVLIKVEQYEKIRPLMQELGFEEKLESDHELIWTKPSLYLELHKRIIPSYNKDYAAYFGDGWRLGRQCPGRPSRYEMSDEDQMLYLFTHFAKHYRGGGVGIRHLVDLYVYRKAKPQLDEAYMAEELKKLQLDGFYRNICDTISVWFENGTHNEKTKLITDVLFDSGSFGSKENRMVADSTRDAAAGGAKKVRRKKLLHMLFPPCDVLSGRYPILEKLPILLPFMWVVRWVSAVLFRRKNIETQRNRMQSMSEDRVTSFEQSLKAVDLGFHFEE